MWYEKTDQLEFSLPDHGLKVVMAGGGTGGHLFPAVAISEALKAKVWDIQIHFVGSKYGIEASKFPSGDDPFTLLNIRGFSRGFSVAAVARNLLFPWRFLTAYWQSRQLLTHFSPDVVVGTGGYASGLPLLAAVHKKIPTLIHEQNSFPGFTTRWLADRVERLCLSYEESAAYLKKKVSISLAILCAKI